MDSKKRVRMLCEGAVMIAIAQVLSMIKLWEMPWGGSIVLAMVPIILFSVRWGLGSGLMAGLVFGILQFMFDGGFALGWQSIIGDYLVAFMVLGLAGIAKGHKGAVYIGAIIGGFARFIVHFVVGATVWAAYMPDVYFGMPMSSPWFYSFLYNMAYMLPNICITLFVFLLLNKPMHKYFNAEDLK